MTPAEREVFARGPLRGEPADYDVFRRRSKVHAALLAAAERIFHLEEEVTSAYARGLEAAGRQARRDAGSVYGALRLSRWCDRRAREIRRGKR